MIKLECLQDPSPRKRRTKLLGRGPSSGHGKTSGRGHKGDGSRSGYKRRFGYEGEAYLYTEEFLHEDFLINALINVLKKSQHNV